MWPLPPRLVRLALVALAAASGASAQGTTPPPPAAVCPPGLGSLYSFTAAQNAACCPTPGSAIVSAALGCKPDATVGGPDDTKFYFSGSGVEGVAGFTAAVAAPAAFVADRFGAAGQAASFAGGGVDAGSAALSANLPSGAGPMSAAAWVKCAAPASPAAALSWGAVPAPVQASSVAAPMTRFGITVTSGVGGPFPVLTASVRTVAGNSLVAGTADGVGTSATLTGPRQGTFDGQGGLIFVDSGGVTTKPSLLRRLNLATGAVSTLAGSTATGTGGYADGLGSSALFTLLSGIAIDASGNIYTSESQGNSRIRRTARLPNGTYVVSTIAGAGTAGNVVGTGTNAQFNSPFTMGFVQPWNSLVIADYNNNCIKMVNLTNNAVSLLAGGGAGTATNGGYNTGSADGPCSSATFTGPHGLVTAPDGTVYVADLNGHKIRRITGGTTAACTVTTIAGSFGASTAGIVDAVGTNARFNTPRGMALDSSSRILYIVETTPNRIRKLDLNSMMVSTYAGRPDVAAAPAGSLDGEAVNVATFNSPYGVAFDGTSGMLYVFEDKGNVIRGINTTSGLPAAFPVCDGRWHHCALTLGAGGVTTAYIDGALAGTGVVAAGFAVTTAGGAHVAWGGNLSIGGGELYSGELADLRAYGRALAASEVAAMALPVFPAVAGAVAPTPALGAKSYTYACPAGSAGPVTSYVQRAADLSWTITNAGATSCAVCAANTYIIMGVGCTPCPAGSNSTSASAGCACAANTMWNNRSGAALACATCPKGASSAAGDFVCSCGPNYVPSNPGTTALSCICPAGFSTAGAGAGATCFQPCAAGTYSTVAGGACVACPANGVSGADARTCTCGANSTSNGLSGAALVCRACPSNAVSLGGTSDCNCLGFWDTYDPVSNVCVTPPSATASVTPSPTSSPTSTVSITPSNTGSNTQSLTRTPSRKSTPRIPRGAV